jgi:hypothetical protein
MRNMDHIRTSGPAPRRQAIGFIPRGQENEENDGIEDELHTLREIWDARQLAEALEIDQMLKDSHEALFEQVRLYADQLERLDPDAYNVAQEVSEVVLTLSCAETAQERLDALASEAGRLMLAVGEAKRRCGRREKLAMLKPMMLAVLCSLLVTGALMLLFEGATPF